MQRDEITVWFCVQGKMQDNRWVGLLELAAYQGARGSTQEQSQPLCKEYLGLISALKIFSFFLCMFSGDSYLADPFQQKMLTHLEAQLEVSRSKMMVFSSSPPHPRRQHNAC